MVTVSNRMDQNIGSETGSRLKDRRTHNALQRVIAK
jgi:hypothetical protein